MLQGLARAMRGCGDADPSDGVVGSTGRTNTSHIIFHVGC